MTHLLFICSFAFCLLAVGCFELQSRALKGLYWKYFGIFAVAGAIHFFIQLSYFIYSDFIQLKYLSLAFEVSSYVALIAFARNGIKSGITYFLGKWIYALAIAYTIVIVVVDINLFEFFVRSLFGVCGTVFAAYTIVRHENRIKPNCPLTWLSVSLLLYSLYPLLALKIFAPSNIIELNQIIDIVNHPTLLLICLTLLLMMGSVWRYLEQLCSAQQTRTFSFGRCLHVKKLLVIIGLVIVFGVILTEYIANLNDRTFREQFFNTSRLMASAIDLDKVSALQGQKEDMAFDNYKDLEALLKGFGDSVTKLRYLYLMGRKGTDIKYYLDTEPSRYEEPGETKETGEIYPEATEALKESFDRGEEFIEGPVADEWGVWISAIVPLKDKINNNVIAVFGVDIDAAQWVRDVGESRFEPIIISMLIGFAVSAFFLVLQKFRENAANESEKRYQRLVEGSPNGVMLFNREGVCQSANSASTVLFGFDKEQLIGRNISSFWEDSSLLIFEKGLVRLEASGISQFQVSYKGPDGDGKTFEIVLCPVTGEEHIRGGYVATIADVTARKLAETSLKESELKFKTLFDNASDGILLTCAGLLVDSNNRAVSMFGYHQEQLANRWPQAVSPELQPDGTRSGMRLVEFGDLAMSGSPQKFKWIFQKKDESCFEAEVFITRIEIGGTSFLETIIRSI